jgi:hypothetical protein
MLTTEALVADMKEDEKEGAAGGGGGMPGGGGPPLGLTDAQTAHGRNVLNRSQTARKMKALREIGAPFFVIARPSAPVAHSDPVVPSPR